VFQKLPRFLLLFPWFLLSRDHQNPKQCRRIDSYLKSSERDSTEWHRSEIEICESVHEINHISAFDIELYYVVRNHNCVRIIPSHDGDTSVLILHQFLIQWVVQSLRPTGEESSHTICSLAQLKKIKVLAVYESTSRKANC
jgi:hypothetical protein